MNDSLSKCKFIFYIFIFGSLITLINDKKRNCFAELVLEKGSEINVIKKSWLLKNWHHFVPDKDQYN